MNFPLRILLLLALSIGAALPAHSQLAVSLEIKRRLFMIHEPILATVVLTNRSGRDLTLADTTELQWFGFQITGEGDSVVPPRKMDYRVDPLDIKAGETFKRTVNLNELYALGDFGSYKVRATIYHTEAKKYFTSRAELIELTEGRLTWTQSVGVPEGVKGGGGTRVYSLLKHQQDEQTMLYVRVEDREEGMIYGTYPLGRLIQGLAPQAELDAANNLYILQLVGQRAYVLSKIGINGEFLGRTNYSAPKTRPTLRKLPDGTLQIIGGQRENPAAQAVAAAAAAETPPKLSDRPVGLPVK